MTKPNWLTCALVAFATFAVAPAGAQDLSQTCRNAGNSYTVGELACIAACHGAQRLARCDPAAEGATWTYISDVCPSARLMPPLPDDASRIPTLAAMTPRPVPVMMSAIAPDMLQSLAALRTKGPAAH